MHTSDHDYLELELSLDKEPYKVQPKEFFYSNLINHPKAVQLESYLEYIMKYLELVIDNKLDKQNFDRIKS